MNIEERKIKFLYFLKYIYEYKKDINRNFNISSIDFHCAQILNFESDDDFYFYNLIFSQFSSLERLENLSYGEIKNVIEYLNNLQISYIKSQVIFNLCISEYLISFYIKEDTYNNINGCTGINELIILKKYLKHILKIFGFNNVFDDFEIQNNNIRNQKLENKGKPNDKFDREPFTDVLNKLKLLINLTDKENISKNYTILRTNNTLKGIDIQNNLDNHRFSSGSNYSSETYTNNGLKDSKNDLKVEKLPVINIGEDRGGMNKLHSITNDIKNENLVDLNSSRNQRENFTTNNIYKINKDDFHAYAFNRNCSKCKKYFNNTKNIDCENPNYLNNKLKKFIKYNNNNDNNINVKLNEKIEKHDLRNQENSEVNYNFDKHVEKNKTKTIEINSKNLKDIKEIINKRYFRDKENKEYSFNENDNANSSLFQNKCIENNTNINYENISSNLPYINYINSNTSLKDMLSNKICYLVNSIGNNSNNNYNNIEKNCSKTSDIKSSQTIYKNLQNHYNISNINIDYLKEICTQGCISIHNERNKNNIFQNFNIILNNIFQSFFYKYILYEQGCTKSLPTNIQTIYFIFLNQIRNNNNNILSSLSKICNMCFPFKSNFILLLNEYIKNNIEKYKISLYKFLLKNELKASTNNTENENVLNKEKLDQKEVNERDEYKDEEGEKKEKKKKKTLLYANDCLSKKTNFKNNLNNQEAILKDNKTDEMDCVNKNNNDKIKIICLNYFDNNKLLENSSTLNSNKIKNSSICDITPCPYSFLNSHNENKSCDNELKTGINNSHNCVNNNSIHIEKNIEKTSNINDMKIDDVLKDDNDILFNYIKNNSISNSNGEFIIKNILNYLYGNSNNNFNNNYFNVCDNYLNKYKNSSSSNNYADNKCSFNNFNHGAFILAKIIKQYLTDIEDPLNNYEDKVIDYLGNNLNFQILKDKINNFNCCTNNQHLNKKNHSKLDKNASVNIENPLLHNASFLNCNNNILIDKNKNEKCFCKCKCKFKNNNITQLKEKSEVNHCLFKNSNIPYFGRFDDTNLKGIDKNNYNCNEKASIGNFSRENPENKINNKICIKNKIHSYLNYNYLCNLEKKKKNSEINFDNFQLIETNMNNENAVNNLNAFENDKNNFDSFTNTCNIKKCYQHGEYVALNDHIKIKFDTCNKINCSHTNFMNPMKAYECIKMKNTNKEHVKSNYIIDLNDYKGSIICVKNVTSIHINKSSILLFGSNTVNCEDDLDKNNRFIIDKEINYCYNDEESKIFNKSNICYSRKSLPTTNRDLKKTQVENILLHNINEDSAKKLNTLNNIHDNSKIASTLNAFDNNNFKISNKLNNVSIDKQGAIKLNNENCSKSNNSNLNISSNYLKKTISLNNNSHNIEQETLKNIISTIKIKKEKDDDTSTVSKNLNNSSNSFEQKEDKLNKLNKYSKKRMRDHEEHTNNENEKKNKRLCKHFSLEAKKNNYNSICNEDIKNNLIEEIIKKIIVCYLKNNINYLNNINKINNFNDKNKINDIYTVYGKNNETNDNHMNNHNSKNETDNSFINKNEMNSNINNNELNNDELNNDELNNDELNNDELNNEDTNNIKNNNNNNNDETNDNYEINNNKNINEVCISYINNICKNNNDTINSNVVNNIETNYNCVSNNTSKINEENFNFTNNNSINYNKARDNYKCINLTDGDNTKQLVEKVKNEKIKCINNTLSNYMKKITSNHIGLENSINDNVVTNPCSNDKKQSKSCGKMIDINYDKNKRKCNKQKCNLNYNTLLTQFDFLEYSNNEKSFFLNNNFEENMKNQNISVKMKNTKNISNNELRECLHSLNNKMKECLQEKYIKNKVKSEEYMTRKENNSEQCDGFIEYDNNINNSNITKGSNDTKINEELENEKNYYFSEKGITGSSNNNIKPNSNNNNINIKKESNIDSKCTLKVKEQVTNKNKLFDFSKNINELDKNKEPNINKNCDLSNKNLENNNTTNSDVENHSFINSRTSKSFYSIEDYINDSDNSKKKKVDKNKLENYKTKNNDEKKKRKNKKDYSNSLLMKHDPPIPGVSFDRIKNRWVAGLRTENGRYIRKYFSVLRFGMEEAKYKAIECRINYGSSKCKRKGKMNADIKNALIYCQNIDRNRLINILDEECGKSLFI
ncbi:hypothetical protein PRELSG_1206700 [Plasmodium relictum]|uniref:AP2/ERF domain-containing protein n=1 Tax=Plasmodium relictum TaxID=85471 RepID=A0A1J1H887_PLARL|nr:hypothetical protein PRELSG_1206700 [Plasmodium relictum]CRH01184.1 hypothetical protein PRELSG_1206700 [Plasmodium relictum]